MVTERSGIATNTATKRRGFDAWPLIVAAIAVVIDQVTKAMVINAFGPSEDGKYTVIIPNVLDFRHDQNTGSAFSLFQGRSTFLLLIGLIVIGILVFYYRSLPQGNPLLRIAVGAVLGGAVGNIIDRVRLGHVTDWFHIAHYPTFNFADSCITVGMLTLAIYFLFLDRPARREG